MSRHISTINYLRSADTCLTRTVIYWLQVRTCYDGQCKQMLCFGGHFNPKSLVARTLSYDRRLAQISMLPSGDRKQYACVMNHVIVASQTLWLVLRHHIVMCLNPRSTIVAAMSKKRTLLSFYHCASCRALAIEPQGSKLRAISRHRRLTIVRANRNNQTGAKW